MSRTAGSRPILLPGAGGSRSGAVPPPLGPFNTLGGLVCCSADGGEAPPLHPPKCKSTLQLIATASG
jgi:hypothetical protein